MNADTQREINLHIRGRVRRKMERYQRWYPCQDYWAFVDVLMKHLEKRIIEWKKDNDEFKKFHQGD